MQKKMWHTSTWFRINDPWEWTTRIQIILTLNMMQLTQDNVIDKH